jgi:hypothetical protein
MKGSYAVLSKYVVCSQVFRLVDVFASNDPVFWTFSLTLLSYPKQLSVSTWTSHYKYLRIRLSASTPCRSVPFTFVNYVLTWFPSDSTCISVRFPSINYLPTWFPSDNTCTSVQSTETVTFPCSQHYEIHLAMRIHTPANHSVFFFLTTFQPRHPQHIRLREAELRRSERELELLEEEERLDNARRNAANEQTTVEAEVGELERLDAEYIAQRAKEALEKTRERTTRSSSRLPPRTAVVECGSISTDRAPLHRRSKDTEHSDEDVIFVEAITKKVLDETSIAKRKRDDGFTRGTTGTRRLGARSIYLHLRRRRNEQ